MANARFAWGIDVGNRALKAIKLVQGAEGLRVDDFEVIEHDQVLSNAGDNREQFIQSSLAGFVQRHQIKGGVAAVGVSGQSSFARFIKLPPVEEKKIPEIVRFEAIQQIPFPLDDVEWSYQLFRDPNSPDVEVGIFAMRKELVNHHIKYFTDVDLNVQVVQMSPLAVYNAMYHDGRLQGTTMIVDMGAENTDLIIADGDSVWMRSIPIGGNNFTESLVKAFKINFAKAEEMKRNAATSKYARQIFQAMRPVFADFVAEIQRSIGFYSSVHRDSRISRILALGGTFRLPGLQKYLQQNLQLDVERVDGFVGGAPADPKAAATFNENILSLAGAYGLAIQAMGQAKIESSLLPQHIRKAQMWQEKTKWFGAAAALFVAGTGVAFASLYLNSAQFESASAREARNNISRVQSQASELDARWTEVESAGAAEKEQIKNLRSLLAYRDVWSRLIVDIYQALPQPQPEVASGRPEEMKKVPRAERQVIRIDQVKTKFVPDVGPAVNARNLDRFRQEIEQMQGLGPFPTPSAPTGGGAGMDMMGMPPEMMGMYGAPTDAPAEGAGPGGRGFLILVSGTTPNKGGASMIENTFLTNLLKNKPPLGPNQTRNYEIRKAALVSANPISANPNRLQQMSQAMQGVRTGQAGGGFNPYGGMGGMGGMGMPPEMMGEFGMGGYGGPMGGMPGMPGAQPQEQNPYIDRLTGEDVREDWEFTALLAVVLDPPPPAPAGEEVPSGEDAPADDAAGAEAQPAAAAQ